MIKPLCIIAILIITMFGNLSAQVQQVNDAPLYELGGQSEKGLAHFADANFKDSLKVFFRIKINFGKPFKIGSANIKTVQLLDMRAVNIQKTNYPLEFYLTSNKKPRCKKHKDFWNRYGRYIVAWYEKIPYEKLKNPEFEGVEELTFTGVFIIVPQKDVTSPKTNYMSR